MTEAEWLHCTDPQNMLGFLRGKASDRKLRLFGVACCRKIWHLLTDESSSKAVEANEQFADGLLTKQDLEAAQIADSHIYQFRERLISEGQVQPQTGVNWRQHLQLIYDLSFSRFFSLHLMPGAVAGDAERLWQEQEGGRSDILHDLFGNPFRPVSITPAWLTSTMLALAQAAYDNRSLPAGTLDKTCLAILADALEEVGCHDARILAHCRQPGDHVRGCWVVDLVLGKK